MAKLTDSRSSAVRAVLRAALVCVTAFGFKLDAAQVAAIQMLGEAILAAAVQLTTP
jgi:hypothetical protein